MRIVPFPRWLDIVSSCLGLVILSPLFLFLAVSIKVTSRGPVFFTSDRVGKGGRCFRLYKFRSMCADAATTGSGITMAHDPRITRIGSWMRAWKLDELAQLINVVKGEMSLVGPRPEDPRFVEHYPTDLKSILEFTPGITSAASLVFRHESSLLTSGNHEDEYTTMILPAKLRIDVHYFSNATLSDHMKLLLRTIFRMKANFT